MGTTPTAFPKLRGSDSTLSRTQDNVNIQLGPISQALSQTPIMGSAPIWTPVTLDAAFASLGAPYATAAYYKDALWRVWSVGVLVSAAGVGAGATVFTFPMGLRPSSTQRKAVEGSGATAQFVSIDAAGVVTVEVAVGAGGTLDVDFSFLVAG